VQAALNVVMTANPIGLLVIALVALGAGLVVAYKKSETFRAIVDGTFKAIKSVVTDVLDFIVPKVKAAFGVIADVVRVAVGIVKGYVGAYAKAAKAIVSAIIDAFDFLKKLPGKVAGFLRTRRRRSADWVGNFAGAAWISARGSARGSSTGWGTSGI
jgi:phage-related protein